MCCGWSWAANGRMTNSRSLGARRRDARRRVAGGKEGTRPEKPNKTACAGPREVLIFKLSNWKRWFNPAIRHCCPAAALAIVNYRRPRSTRNANFLFNDFLLRLVIACAKRRRFNFNNFAAVVISSISEFAAPMGFYNPPLRLLPRPYHRPF